MILWVQCHPAISSLNNVQLFPAKDFQGKLNRTIVHPFCEHLGSLACQSLGCAEVVVTAEA